MTSKSLETNQNMKSGRAATSARLGQARRLTRALGGTWNGHTGSCLCPAHKDRNNPSLSLSDGANGVLLAYCFAGCSFGEVTSALRAMGLIGAFSSTCGLVTRKHVRPSGTASLTNKHTALIRRIWAASVPIYGTLAEAYLRRRGITCALPDSLRFTASCWHMGGSRLPAMIARVDHPAGFAIQRTYLNANRSQKADVVPNRAMLGRTSSGAVQISASPYGPLVVAEGIETALSLASGLFDGPATILATLGTSGMKNLRLDGPPGALVIAADGDVAGRKGAQTLNDRARLAGWTVDLMPAPEGLDWNDVLMQTQGADQ